MQNTHADLVQVIHDYMSDPETDWRIGEQAVFSRGAEEEVDISLDHAGGSILAQSGAVRVAVMANTRLVPAEGLSGDLWVQAGLLCLRDGDAGMARRTVLTELGSDMLAARSVDRLGTLFDLGRGGAQTDLCVRSADAELCALLRAREGSVMESDDGVFDAIESAGADFVATSRLGRIETFGRQGSPDTALELAAPSGYANCLSFAPPRPDHAGPFDEATYGAFRVLYGIFADPALVKLKQSVGDALRNGGAPDSLNIGVPDERLAVAVMLRQLARRDGPSEILSRWLDAFEA